MAVLQRKEAASGESRKWSEGVIAGAIARQTLASKCVVLVDRCNWTGHECDVLAVTKDLRIIDVEIKISRADLRADAKKEKWWHREFVGYGEREETRNELGVVIRVNRPFIYDSTPKQWPHRVWKHYYAMPADIWTDDLIECLPSGKSGVILLRWQESSATPVVATVVRRATPNRDAVKLTPEQVIDVARLANLRMWNAYQRSNDGKGMV